MKPAWPEQNKDTQVHDYKLPATRKSKNINR